MAIRRSGYAQASAFSYILHLHWMTTICSEQNCSDCRNLVQSAKYKWSRQNAEECALRNHSISSRYHEYRNKWYEWKK